MKKLVLTLSPSEVRFEHWAGCVSLELLYVKVDEPERLAEVLKTIPKKYKRERIFVLVEGYPALVTTQTAPRVEPNRQLQILMEEAGRWLPQPLETYYWDCAIVGQDDYEVTYRLCAAKREALAHVMEAVGNAGLEKAVVLPRKLLDTVGTPFGSEKLEQLPEMDLTPPSERRRRMERRRRPYRYATAAGFMAAAALYLAGGYIRLEAAIDARSELEDRKKTELERQAEKRQALARRDLLREGGAEAAAYREQLAHWPELLGKLRAGFSGLDSIWIDSIDTYHGIDNKRVVLHGTALDSRNPDTRVSDEVVERVKAVLAGLSPDEVELDLSQRGMIRYTASLYIEEDAGQAR